LHINTGATSFGQPNSSSHIIGEREV